MKIVEIFSDDYKEHWLSEIKRCDQKPGRILFELLKTKKLKDVCGEKTKVLLLTEGERLISFCTYSVKDESFKPAVSFCYTFPEYKGKRRMGKLLEYAYLLAKSEEYEALYISAEDTGIYEKYGFEYWKNVTDYSGDSRRIYRKKIWIPDYSEVMGTTVSGTVDRPLGTAHPRHKDMIYPINYGYVDGVFAGDDEEQDVYIFGTDQPLETFSGRVVGVYHRLNDNEDKWIVSLDGNELHPQEVLEAISFQEQYYMGELYLL